MALLDILTSGKLNILLLFLGYISLTIGLYYFGYSQGRSRCDRNRDTPVNADQYRGGQAGIIIGCILIVIYHIIEIRKERRS